MSELETVAAAVATEPDVLLEAPHEEGRRKGLGLGAWLAIVWLGLLLFVAVFANFLPLSDPAAEVATPQLAPFQEGGHILGADTLGRDMLARLVFGARVSLEISVFSIVIGFIVGGVLGLFSGYYRNWVGKALASLFDILLAIPALVLALALVAVLKGDPLQSKSIPPVLILIITLAIVSVPLVARITRGATLAWSQREFVTAAKAQGATDSRILFREILPNVLPAMVYIALLGIAIAIVAEGSLAILGASVESPQTSWGTLINEGRAENEDAPFLMFLPIIAIFLTVMALNYLGDVIRDRFDVRESAL